MFVLNHKKETTKNNILAKKVAILKNLQHINNNSNIKIQNHFLNQENNKLSSSKSERNVGNMDFNFISNEENTNEENTNEENTTEENTTVENTNEELENLIILQKNLETKIILNDNNDKYLKYYVNNDIKNYIKNDINFYIKNRIYLNENKFINESLQDLKDPIQDLKDPIQEVKESIQDLKESIQDLKEPTHEPNETNQNTLNYQEKMNKIQILINKIINKHEIYDTYIFKQFILDVPNNINDGIINDGIINDGIINDENIEVEIIEDGTIEDINKNEKPKKKVINFNKINKIINEENNLVNVTTDNIQNKINKIVKKIQNKVQSEISKDIFTYGEILTNKESKENIFNMICLSILNKIEKIVN